MSIFLKKNGFENFSALEWAFFRKSCFLKVFALEWRFFWSKIFESKGLNLYFFFDLGVRKIPIGIFDLFLIIQNRYFSKKLTFPRFDFKNLILRWESQKKWSDFVSFFTKTRLERLQKISFFFSKKSNLEFLNIWLLIQPANIFYQFLPLYKRTRFIGCLFL